MPNFWMVSFEPEMSSTRIKQNNGENAERTHQHEGAESTIGKRRAAAVEKVRTDGRERRLSPRRRTAICPLSHVSLTSHSRYLSI